MRIYEFVLDSTKLKTLMPSGAAPRNVIVTPNLII